MAARGSSAGLAALVIGLCAAAAGCPPEQEACLICGDGAGPGAGGDPAAGAPCGDTGRAFFEENVRAILDDGATGEACARCHSGEYTDAYGAPDFLGASAGSAYDALVGDVRFVGAVPEDSLLLTKGAHTGPAFTASQEAVVEQWLAIEAQERSGECVTGGGGGQACEDALADFAACMTLDDWTGTGMHLVSGQDTTAGPCFSCHESGMGDNYMTSPVSDASIVYGFEQMRKLPALRRLATCSAGGEAGALDVVPAYRWRDKGLDDGHPAYLLAEEHLAALDAWFALAHAKWEAGPCGP